MSLTQRFSVGAGSHHLHDQGTGVLDSQGFLDSQEFQILRVPSTIQQNNFWPPINYNLRWMEDGQSPMRGFGNWAQSGTSPKAQWIHFLVSMAGGPLCSPKSHLLLSQEGKAHFELSSWLPGYFTSHLFKHTRSGFFNPLPFATLKRVGEAAKGNLFEHVSVRLDQKFDLGRSRLGENVQDQLTGLLYFRTWPYRLDGIQNQITLWPQRDRATEDIWRAFGTKTFLGNIPALLLGLFLLFFSFKELEHSKLRLGLEIWNAPPTGIEGLGEKHSHYPSQTQSSDTDLPLKWGAKWMDLQRTAELCSPSKDHVPGS